jgi:hypothetical protein
MVDVLKVWQRDWKQYWDKLFFFAWYLYASRIERLHPMNCGFWTVRNRGERRSGFPREAFISFWWGRLNSAFFRTREIAKLFFQFEEVWLRSRPKTKIEEALQELLTKTKQEIIDSRSRVVDWRELKVRELVALYEKLHDEMPEVKVPSKLALWLKKRNPFAASYTRAYAQRIWRRWYVHVWNPLKWVEVWLFEWFNGLRFLTSFLALGR